MWPDNNLLIVLAAFSLSLALTYLVIRYAKLNLLDHPNERSSHELPTPRGGGLAIVLVVLFGLLLYLLLKQTGHSTWYGFLGATGLVAVISYIDDHRHVPASQRLLVHLLAACLAVLLFTKTGTLNVMDWRLNTSWVLFPLAILLLVWLLNLFNFMDGIDGIASVEALFVALAMLVLADNSGVDDQTFVVSLLLLSAAVAGFLVWNWPSAKIFMGDVGSSFLGFVLAALGLYAVARGWLNLWSVLILFGLFLVDASFTLIRRMLRGERWYEAHRSHAYQKVSRLLASSYASNMDAMVARQQSHRKLCYAVSLMNILWLFPFAWMSIKFEKYAFLIMLVAFLPIILLVWKYDAGLPDEST
ncbi:MAG: glycosyltransferase family 4 protein [Chromatiales bacterium]|jgi:Fuc2NAc and GlcNAc transferase